MAVYKIEVTTGDKLFAGTVDYVYVTLIGAKGESERTLLANWTGFTRGQSGCYSVETPATLEELFLLKVEKDPFLTAPEDEWFCSKIVVTTPEEEVILFPCHRWVSRGELVELRGGPARKIFEDDQPVLLEHRRKELELRKQLYQYSTLAEGLPKCPTFKETSDIPSDISLSASKTAEVLATQVASAAELKLKALSNSTENWKDLEELKSVFCCRTSPIYEYVTEHWKDDDFYGFQFLNGVNPNKIQRCSQLPPNFPVKEDILKPFLQECTSLQGEMEKGNVFLCDYKELDGLPNRVYNGEELTAAAGFCLLYKNPQDELRPIAIQLQQEPSDKNPIFLPSDTETDWLLAKMFIRNADQIQHQLVHHLMNTHFLVQGFAMATLRNLPLIHPLYKLLIPHFRYTIHVSTLARANLRENKGFANQNTLEVTAWKKLMARVHANTTYSSLCLPENITARGLESVPNFYYRDDGLKLWGIIQSFAKEMVDNYYPSNEDVVRDSELQAWITDIFTNTFLEKAASGIPQDFHNVEDLTKFVTMVIFTASAQHAAVHNGQFDYIGWLPNNPAMLCKPAPTTKEQSSLESILEALPNKGLTVERMSTMWTLAKSYQDFVPLGSYPSEHFGEPIPKQIIKAFQAELAYLSEEITNRNSALTVPYEYLNPALIENSISV